MTLSELTKQADALATAMARTRVKGFEIPVPSAATRIPFMARSYREVLLMRTSELASGAVDGLKRKRPVVAATLTRSVIESVAKAHELQRLLDGFVLDPQQEPLDTSLMKLLFGSRRLNDRLPKATNILTSIDHTESMIPNFRQSYDRLSELAHPNFQGGLGVYAEIDMSKNQLVLASQDRRNGNLEMIANFLIAEIRAFTVFYKYVGSTIETIERLS